MAEAVAQAMAATRASGGGASSGNIHKHYTRLDKLTPEDWKEWHYQFTVATHAYNAKNGALLEIVEQKELDEVTTENLELELDANEADWMRRSKSEMFSVLTLLTKGEANQLVRSCEDMNGYTAWKKLYDRYNPKTPASLTAAWREVIRPKKIKDMREASKAIDAWESKVVMLKKEHSEEPTTGLKASLLLEMLPDSVQLTVAQGMSSKKLDYDTLKSKIKLMANVQMDYATPKPMDIGEANEEHDHGWESGGWGSGVEAVGVQKGKGKGPMFGSCWTCGGNHFSRECPKGGGKGQKGFGKGEEKGKGKGKSSGPMFGSCWTCGGAHFSRDCPKGDGGGGGAKGSGKGKGKAIKCFKCGGVGHRAAQCPTSVREVEYEEEEGEQGEVESVSEHWGIFGVEERGGQLERRLVGHRWQGCRQRCGFQRGASEGGAPTSGGVQPIESVGLGRGALRRQGRWDRGVGRSLVTSNRFEALRDEDEEDEGDWIQWCVEEKEQKGLGKGEIVVDSGAAESVCPWDWANQFPLKEVAPENKRNFRNASGGKMEHYGEKLIRCGVQGRGAPVGMVFQVTDAKNPLVSVARITEKGNLVQFGPDPADNYIYNPKTDEKVMLRRKGRKYIMDVEFMGGGPPFSGQA